MSIPFPVYVLALRSVLPVQPYPVASAPHRDVISSAAVLAIAETSDPTEPTLIPLTEDLVTRYLAIRKDVFAIIQKDPALVISIKEHGQHYTFTLQGPGGMSQGKQEIVLPNFVALTTTVPAVAAVFKQYGLAPSQFAPVTIAIRKALFAEALHEAKGWTVKDPASVAGKNIAFVAAHQQEFAGSGLQYNVQAQHGNGDGNDLSP